MKKGDKVFVVRCRYYRICHYIGESVCYKTYWSQEDVVKEKNGDDEVLLNNNGVTPLAHVFATEEGAVTKCDGLNRDDRKLKGTRSYAY